MSGRNDIGMYNYYGVENGLDNSFFCSTWLCLLYFCFFFFNVSLCLKTSLLGRLVSSRKKCVNLEYLELGKLETWVRIPLLQMVRKGDLG